MKNTIFKIVIILFAFFITFCRKNSSLIIQKNFTGMLTANEWKVIGAFEFDSLKQKANNTFQNKDLKSFGINEESFEESDFDKFNGSKLKPFVVECRNSPVRLFDHFDKKAKNNYYFMKGDNFYGSEDSQFWGFVPEGNIIGKVVFIIMSKEPEESMI